MRDFILSSGITRLIRVWNCHIKWHLWGVIFKVMEEGNIYLDRSKDQLGRDSLHVANHDAEHIPRNKLYRFLHSKAHNDWQTEWAALSQAGAAQRTRLLSNNDRSKIHPASNNFIRNPAALTDREFSFALKARCDMLPCNSNLHRWGLKASAACSLCRKGPICQIDTGCHRLNMCQKKMSGFSHRHNALLSVLAAFVDKAPNRLTLWDQATPASHFGVSSTLRPDIQVFDTNVQSDARKKAALLDMKVPYHGRSFVGCHEENVRKYQHLADRLKRANPPWKESVLDTIVVSSDGIIPMHTANILTNHLHIPKSQIHSLLSSLSIIAIKESCHLF